MNNGEKSFPSGGRPHLAVAATFLALCAGIVLWHEHFAFIQFGGMDGGVLINIAWMQHLGLAPYRDFPCVPPPLFVYPAGWAFHVWGPTWSALTCLTCLYAVVTFTWMFLLLWAATARAWQALGFALLVQMVAMFPLSWWWYNQVGSVMLALYFGSVLFLLLQPQSRFARLSFFAAVTLTALAKPNTAGLLLLLSLVPLLRDHRTRRFILVAIPSAALLDVVFLWLHHVGPFTLLENYLQVGSRLFYPRVWWHCLGVDTGSWRIYSIDLFATVGLILTLIYPLRPCSSLLRQRKLFFAFIWMFVTAALVFILGCVTDGDAKALEASSFLILLPFLRLFSDKLLPWIPAYLILAYFACMALLIGATRQRVMSVQKNVFFESAPLVRLENPPLFRGLEAGPHLRQVLDDARALLDKEQGSTKKIFFGPRIDFLYAAYDLPVVPGLPLWWEKVNSTHHGQQYPSSVGPENSITGPAHWIPDGQPLDPRVQLFLNVKFELCIFLKTEEGIADMTFIPADIRGELYEHYHLEDDGSLIVFVRR